MVSTSSSKSHGDLPQPSEVQQLGRDSFGANHGRSWFSKSLKSFSRLKTALKKRTVSGTRGAHNAGSPRGPNLEDAGSPRGPCPVSPSTATPKAASTTAAASPTARDTPLLSDVSRGSPRVRASPVTWAPSLAIPAPAPDDQAVTADRLSRPEGQPHPSPPSPTSAAPTSPSRAPFAPRGSRCSPSRLSPSSLRPSSPTHPSPTPATPAPQLPYLPNSSAALVDRDAERTSPIYGQYQLYGCPTDALMHLASIQEESAMQASPPDSGRDTADADHKGATECAAAASPAPTSLAAAAASAVAAPPALQKANSGEVLMPGDLAAARLSLPGGSTGMGAVSGFGFNVSARRLLGRQPAVSSPLGARSSSGNGSAAAAAAPEAPHQRAVRIARGVHSPHTSSRALLTRQRTPFALRRTPPNLPSSASALRLQDAISPPVVPRGAAAAGTALHAAHSGTLPPGLQLCTGSVEGFMSERDSVPGTGRPACPESADGVVDPWQWTRQALRGSSSGAMTLGDDGLQLTLPPPVRTYGGGTSPAVAYRHRAAQRSSGGPQARFVGGLSSPCTRAPAILARQQTPCPLRHGGWLDSWDVASGTTAFVVLGGEPDRERDREVYDGIVRQSLDGMYGRPRLGTQDGGATTDAGSEASGTLGVMPAQVRAWGRVMGLRSGRSRAMSRQSSLQRALHVQLQVTKSRRPSLASSVLGFGTGVDTDSLPPASHANTPTRRGHRRNIILPNEPVAWEQLLQARSSNPALSATAAATPSPYPYAYGARTNAAVGVTLPPSFAQGAAAGLPPQGSGGLGAGPTVPLAHAYSDTMSSFGGPQAAPQFMVPGVAAEPRMIAAQALAPSALAAAWSRDSSLSGLPPYLHHPGGPGPAPLSMQQPHCHLCSAPHVVAMPMRFWPPSPAIMSDNALLQSGNGMPPPPLDASERPVGMCHAYISPLLRAGSTYPDIEAEAAVAAAAAAAAASAATASVRTSVGGGGAVTAAELAAEMAASLRAEDLVPGRPPVIPKREHGQQQQQSGQPASGDKGVRGLGLLRPPHALLQLSINPDPSAPTSGAEGRGGSACTSPMGRSPLSPSSSVKGALLAAPRPGVGRASSGRVMRGSADGRSPLGLQSAAASGAKTPTGQAAVLRRSHLSMGRAASTTGMRGMAAAAAGDPADGAGSPIFDHHALSNAQPVSLRPRESLASTSVMVVAAGATGSTRSQRRLLQHGGSVRSHAPTEDDSAESLAKLVSEACSEKGAFDVENWSEGLAPAGFETEAEGGQCAFALRRQQQQQEEMQDVGLVMVGEFTDMADPLERQVDVRRVSEEVTRGTAGAVEACGVGQAAGAALRGTVCLKHVLVSELLKASFTSATSRLSRCTSAARRRGLGDSADHAVFDQGAEVASVASDGYTPQLSEGGFA